MIDAAFIALPILCSDCPTGRKEFIDNNKRGYLFLNDNKVDFLNKFDTSSQLSGASPIFRNRQYHFSQSEDNIIFLFFEKEIQFPKDFFRKKSPFRNVDIS